MILSSKQLEELENLHDSVSEFDEEANASSDSEDFDEVAEGALAWRRGMLERAVLNVKKIERNPLSSKDNLAVGSLVFDTINSRFARVKSSSLIEAELNYVSGGESNLKGAVIQMTSAPTKKPELKKKAEKAPAVKKPMAEKPPVKKPEAKKPEPKKVPAKKPAAKKPAPKAPAKKPAAKKPAPKKAPAKKPAAKKPVPKKAPVKKAVAKKPAPKKAAPKKKVPVKKPAPKKVASKKSKPANPNAFIKQNYKKMSNKELAAITGLSEHTIRRKLGEWGLKRPAK